MKYNYEIKYTSCETGDETHTVSVKAMSINEALCAFYYIIHKDDIVSNLRIWDLFMAAAEEMRTPEVIGFYNAIMDGTIIQDVYQNDEVD